MAPEIRIRQATQPTRSTFAASPRWTIVLPSRRGPGGGAAGRAARRDQPRRRPRVANPFAPTAELVDMLRMHRGYVETVAA